MCSRRLSVRMAANTCVESVRWMPRALIHPRALHVVRTVSRNRWVASWASKRSRKIVPQREIEAGVVQVEAQRIFPIHAAAHGSGGLAVGEPFHILPNHDQRQAPGRYFHGAARRRIEIGKELIGIECAELRAKVDIECAFGKGGTHCR